MALAAQPAAGSIFDQYAQFVRPPEKSGFTRDEGTTSFTKTQQRVVPHTREAPTTAPTKPKGTVETGSVRTTKQWAPEEPEPKRTGGTAPAQSCGSLHTHINFFINGMATLAASSARTPQEDASRGPLGSARDTSERIQPDIGNHMPRQTTLSHSSPPRFARGLKRTSPPACPSPLPGRNDHPKTQDNRKQSRVRH